MGLVNASVPRAELRGEVEALARELLGKNPVVLRAAKLGFKHCGTMSWDQAEDYLYAKLEQSQFLDDGARPRAGPRAVPRREADQAGPADLRAAVRWSRVSATSSAASIACCAGVSSAAVEPTGLTLPAYTALSVLRDQDGLSNARLARRSLVTPQSMSEVLALLVEQGYVRRSAEPGHGRVIRMELTEAGNRALERCDRAVDAVEREMLGDLDAGRGGEPPRRPDPLRADARGRPRGARRRLSRPAARRMLGILLRPKQLRRSNMAKEFEAQTLVEATIGVAAHLEFELEEALAEHQLTRASFLVLAALERADGHTLNQRELVARVRRTSGTMSVRLGRLEHAGIISRRRDPENGRSVTVTLTERGLQLVAGGAADVPGSSRAADVGAVGRRERPRSPSTFRPGSRSSSRMSAWRRAWASPSLRRQWPRACAAPWGSPTSTAC